ncbi:MAG TPA: hypothetical protein VH281_09440 [Gaiellaceae bacterium]
MPGNDSGWPAYARSTPEELSTRALDDPEAVSALGSLLAAAGYTSEGLKEALGDTGRELGAAAAEIPVQLQRLTGSSRRNSLVTLFFLGASVPREEAADALRGVDLEQLETKGVVESAEGHVRSLVRLVPQGEILVAYPPGGEPPSGATLAANTTVRMHFVSALHLESGTGLHALLAARHTDRAFAVDPDPAALGLARFGALLNGLDRVETIEGSDLDAVAGHSFGLIVATPSRVLSPDDDERADSVCREVVRAVATHLSEGGFAHVVVTWMLGADEDWWAPPEQWVAETGCDALILLERAEDSASYAAAHAGSEALARWVGFLRDQAVARIASGIVVLRRRSRGRNWARHEVLPNRDVGPASDQIVRMFVNEDLLASLPADDQLLDEVLAVVEPQRIEQTWRHQDQGLGLESARARLEWGLGFEVGIDPRTIELLARVDGRRRLRDVFEEIARDSQLDEHAVARAGLPAVRRLLELGFLARAS